MIRWNGLEIERNGCAGSIRRGDKIIGLRGLKYMLACELMLNRPQSVKDLFFRIYPKNAYWPQDGHHVIHTMLAQVMRNLRPLGLVLRRKRDRSWKVYWVEVEHEIMLDATAK